MAVRIGSATLLVLLKTLVAFWGRNGTNIQADTRLSAATIAGIVSCLNEAQTCVINIAADLPKGD